MAPIEFQAVVDEEQVIRPPSGTTLPAGTVHVTVRPALFPDYDEKSMEETRNWMLKIVAEVERLDPDLPSDLAWNHDHYAHGAPKR